ncbi:MAG: glycosyltransferase [Ginsengibacter sp.]
MNKRFKYFFSPQPSVEINEYIDNFFNSLAIKTIVVNRGKQPSSRSADFIKYMFRADVMILNWPEDILHLRFGVLQLFASLLTLLVFKMKGGKIIWVCHNKDSHNKRYPFLRKITRSFYATFSNEIIVHSGDALNYFIKEKSKTHFLNHPVYTDPPLLLNDDAEIKTDVLIWGRITPYKGIHEFIGNYKSNTASFSVDIVGSANATYLQTLNKAAASTNVNITNKFLSNTALAEYFNQSKIIVLPYADSDTFSSGALIHSLSSNKIIIGPAIGNFLDLKKAGACIVYENFNELFEKINSLLQDEVHYQTELKRLKKGIADYYKFNTWDNFTEKLLEIIEKNRQPAISDKKLIAATNQL